VRRALPLALSLLTVLNLPATAAARPLAREPDDRPWGRGTLMPSFGLGGSFGSRGGGSLLVAGGLTYFVVNNLGLGLSLRNFTTFLPPSLKSEFPGIEKQIPTNEFSLIPGLTVILYRSYRFSPYISGGVGPVFLNHKRGVVGEWNAGPGVLIGLGRMLAVNLGVNFSMRFPGERCDAAYSYGTGAAAVSFNSCGIRWGIQAGLVFGFGVGRKRNPPPPQPDPVYTPAPYPEPAPYPAPAEPPPTPVVPVPTEEPTTTSPPPATAEPPAVADPPGESVPVAPPPGE
jgi:hypothetical protein